MFSAQHLGEDLWAIEHAGWTMGLRIHLRMTILRLSDGSLLLHSPIPLNPERLEAIAALGEVGHLMAPNLNHYLFLERAREHFPQARVWAPPGLDSKVPGLHIDTPLLPGTRLDDAIELFAIEGVPKNAETLVLHPRSNSLICCDLVANPQQEPSLLSRMLWRSIGVWQCCGTNRLWKWRSKDRQAHRRSIEPLLERSFERLVMAHGEVIDKEGKESFVQAMQWLPQPA